MCSWHAKAALFIIIVILINILFLYFNIDANSFVFITLLCFIASSGALGGYINWLFDKKEFSILTDTPHSSKKEYIIIGIAAALIVPLFLSMISSQLISGLFEKKDFTLSKLYQNILILIGFCLVASISSRSFIKSVSDKILKDVSETKQLTEKHEQELKTTKESLQDKEEELKRTNSSLLVVKAEYSISHNDYQRATHLIDEVLNTNPEYPRALAWKAYLLKREKKYAEAKEKILQAIFLNKKQNHPENALWYYNLACYQALCNDKLEDIIKSLDTAFKINIEVIGTQEELLKDEDFSSINKDADFINFLEKVFKNRHTP